MRVSVVVCAYDAARWPLLCAAIASLQQQSQPADEIILVVDHNDALLQRCAVAFAGAVTVVANADARGLAGARNTAVRLASGDVLAFIDDDAVAEPAWLQELLAPYADPHVLGTGGAALAAWPQRRPAWLPSEFDWVVGCSYTGLPLTTAAVRNPIGASMSFRRQAFALAGSFTNGVGRLGADMMGCEETEFAIRARQADPDARILYTPRARVHHRIDASRLRWRYFMRRCYAEGRSKARVARAVGASLALQSERTYTRQVLPRAALRELRRGCSGDVAGLLRCAAIGAGLSAAAAGYAQARLQQGRAA